MTLDQVIQELDRTRVALIQVEREQHALPTPRRGALQGQVDALREKVASLRLTAFRAIKQGDLKNFMRILGVNHAYDACRILGVGSLQALVSCTRNQFKLLARPESLGWGAADAIPPQIDISVVNEVESVLRSLGLRWREGNEKPRVKLPEPVLSAEFDHTFRMKERFDPSCREFGEYAHPTIAYGVANKTRNIVAELSAHGIYSWEDLTNKTEQSLLSAGLDRRLVKTVQYEMRRRGLTFLKEQKPQAVVMDLIDADKFGDKVKQVTDVSQEDVIKVRNKQRELVAVIEADDELRDRIGADMDEKLIAPREDMFGVVDNYEEYTEDNNEDPQASN